MTAYVDAEVAEEPSALPHQDSQGKADLVDGTAPFKLSREEAEAGPSSKADSPPKPAVPPVAQKSELFLLSPERSASCLACLPDSSVK